MRRGEKGRDVRKIAAKLYCIGKNRALIYPFEMPSSWFLSFFLPAYRYLLRKRGDVGDCQRMRPKTNNIGCMYARSRHSTGFADELTSFPTGLSCMFYSRIAIPSPRHSLTFWPCFLTWPDCNIRWFWPYLLWTSPLCRKRAMHPSILCRSSQEHLQVVHSLPSQHVRRHCPSPWCPSAARVPIPRSLWQQHRTLDRAVEVWWEQVLV